MPVKLENISSISPTAPGQIEVTSDLNLIGTSPVPVYRVNGVPISTGGGSSQWTDIAGGGIYYNGGNVGIGTATPLARLEINAEPSGLNSQIQLRPADGNQQYGLGIGFVLLGGDWKGSLQTVVNGAAGALLLNPAGGNVGINAPNPAARLQIEQPPGGNWNFYLTQSSASWLTAVDFNNYRFIQTASAATDGNFKPFGVGAGGVGIGTGTPSYGSNDALYVNGNVGIGTVNPLTTLDVAGNIRMSGVRTVLFFQGDAASQQGGVQIVGGLGDNNVMLTPTDNAGQPVDGAFRIGGMGAFNSNAVNLVVSSQVGIATNSPQYSLDVGGAGSGAASRLGYMAMLRADAGHEWNLGNFTDNSGSWQLTRRNITTNAWNNAITVNPSGGTSIGTTTVGDQLNIVGFGNNGYGQLRIVEGPYGSFWRQDSASLYLMTTNVNDPWGTWKAPFAFQVDLGSNTIGICASPNASYGLSVGGNLNITGGYYVNGVPLATGGGPTNFGYGNRAVDTVYQNNTGKPMFVSISGISYTAVVQCDSGNPPTTAVGYISAASGTTPVSHTVSLWVLPGYYYRLQNLGVGVTISAWSEWW